jgi:SOS-response transcriptional repressor LexA
MAQQAVLTTQRGEYLILQLALRGGPLTNVGVLLLDPVSDRLYLQLRQDWDKLGDPDDVEVLSLLEEDFHQKHAEMGGEVLLRFLEDTLSNVVRVTQRQSVMVGSFPRTLDRLYERHVQASRVVPFVTHLPLYTAQAAAGKFREDQEVEPEGWIKAPPDLRLSTDMFVAHITGRSMEPKIPDGSLGVFRAGVAGTRQGKLLLIQNRGVSETGGEFTVKRYRSMKVPDGESWRHEKIRLEPLNPEHAAWDLDPSDLDEGGRYRVIAEFVVSLPPEEE